MSLTARNVGMTLPEVLAGLVLLGFLGAAGTAVLIRTTRFHSVARSRVALATALDASLGFLDAEFAEVAPGDLMSATPDGIIYRAIRLDGHACLVGGGSVRIAQARLRASRLPQAGRDSMLILVQTDSGAQWMSSGIHNVTTAQCGTEPAIRLDGDTAVLGSASYPVPSLVPIKTFEVMETRLYYSGGRRWLGARSVSAGEGIQPLAGPFEAGALFALADSAGASATAATAFSILGRMVVARPTWDRSPGAQRDTASSALYPRNLSP